MRQLDADFTAGIALVQEIFCTTPHAAELIIRPCLRKSLLMSTTSRPQGTNPFIFPPERKRPRGDHTLRIRLFRVRILSLGASKPAGIKRIGFFNRYLGDRLTSSRDIVLWYCHCLIAFCKRLLLPNERENRKGPRTGLIATRQSWITVSPLIRFVSVVGIESSRIRRRYSGCRRTTVAWQKSEGICVTQHAFANESQMIHRLDLSCGFSRRKCSRKCNRGDQQQ